MKTIRTSIRHLVMAAVWLAGLGLSTVSLKAQSFTGQNTLLEIPNRLRPIITSVPNSSIIQIRYENKSRGSVRMQLRDKQGKILFDESEPKRKFAGQFDLASLPSGLYTIELSTQEARYRETIRIEASELSRVITFPQPSEDKLIVKQ
ncbi:hypothetical protein IC229_28435 [Spirosoma sp. BT702]|uniref:Secretion system C-terminal sorting domain-containing protein n=1 Tax=Spirosoma profusum TaxID=2771354 RepID=A0A926Y5F4_9BACT|nr:T9SS type A sorting domain-containing protein [Spirosoma profusum]MBD2704600.1 hypothetical protein [Spirosoma profusum]